MCVATRVLYVPYLVPELRDALAVVPQQIGLGLPE